MERFEMELDELMQVFDATASNLGKLDQVWKRAYPLLPTGPSYGSSREYEDLQRIWNDLLPGLPDIDGFGVKVQLPNMDEIGRRYFDEFSISETDFNLPEDIERPGRQLAEYRHRLNRARKNAARNRIQALKKIVETNLSQIIFGVHRNSPDSITTRDSEEVESAIWEIERLMGDATERKGSWGNLHRHLSFGQGHDWHDIHESDWPSVKVDIEAALFSDIEPLPVPKVDLGTLAISDPSGKATTALAWSNLDANQFERLLFDLFKNFSTFQNVQWLTKTNAPDKGRDLSAEWVLDDGTGGVRTERVIIQAKHWLSQSVGVAELSANLAYTQLWEPPKVQALIIATSGHFSVDAIQWAEKHNGEGVAPRIDLWPQSRLEFLLAQKPHLMAEHLPRK